MDKETRDRMDVIELIAKTDVEYSQMSREMLEYEKKYNEVLKMLSEEQRDIICDFVSQCEGMSWRMLEIACTVMRFP